MCDDEGVQNVAKTEEGWPDWVQKCLACGYLRSLDCAPCPGCESIQMDPSTVVIEAPFSLRCYECDADGTDTRAEAEGEGWTEIEFAPDDPSACYLGICPQCKAREGPTDADF